MCYNNVIWVWSGICPSVRLSVCVVNARDGNVGNLISKWVPAVYMPMDMPLIIAIIKKMCPECVPLPFIFLRDAIDIARVSKRVFKFPHVATMARLRPKPERSVQFGNQHRTTCFPRIGKPYFNFFLFSSALICNRNRFEKPLALAAIGLGCVLEQWFPNFLI